jgi:hypothetical protein
MIKWLAQAAQATPGSGTTQHSANTQPGPCLSHSLKRREKRRATAAAAWAGPLLLLGVVPGVVLGLVVVVLLGPPAEQ